MTTSKKIALFLSFILYFIVVSGCGFIQRVPRDPIIDHRCTAIETVPAAYVLAAKSSLHIAYGHTSHGSQLTDGMAGLDAFMGGSGLYAVGQGAGELDLHDSPFTGASDLGNPDYIAWETATRNYLNDAANADTNVVIWSWCGQAGSSDNDIDVYLNLMDQLELDFPDVRFVYMTGHLDGTGPGGTLHLNNEQIRAFCRANNKWLFDFADIESYDPGGEYYLDHLGDDACCYDADGDGDIERMANDEDTPEDESVIPINNDHNWALDWQDNHVQGTDWYTCGSAHSVPLNANRKAYAAWWLWARLAGWNP